MSRPTDKKTKEMVRKAAATKTPIITSGDAKANHGDKTSLKDKTDEYHEELNKLWTILTNKATPEVQRAKILENVSDEVLTDLRSMKNPYKKPVVGSDKYRVLCMSVTNMTQKYAMRFAVTSFAAFMFEMAKEYEPKSAEAFPSENSPEFVAIYHRKIQEYEREKPIRELELMWKRCNAMLDEYKARVAQSNRELVTDEKATTPLSADELKQMNETIRDSFIIRARMIKYKQFYLQKDITSLNDTIEALRRETANLKIETERAVRDVEVCEIKLIKRRLFDEGKSDEIVKIAEERHREHKAKIAKILADPARGGKGVKIEDMDPDTKAAHLRMIEEELSADEVTGDMPVSKFENRLERAKLKRDAAVKNRAEADARLTAALERDQQLKEKMKEHGENLRELRNQYDARFRTASTIIRAKRGDKSAAAALEADLNSEHPLDDIEVDRVDLTEAEYDGLIEDTKRELGIVKTKEEHTMETVQTITDFLLEYLKYDPTNHVSCSYKPHYGPLEKRPKTGEEIQKLRETKLAQFCRSVVPPDDTFFRYRRYTENHYEELRQATDDIYAETSNFEFAAVPLEVFEGDPADAEAVDKKVKEYQRKYADEFETDILAIQFNKWNLLDSWEENRQVRDFFTAKTEIIRRIIEKNEEDAKVGDKINKLRQEKKKRENTAKHGEDAPGLEQVKKSVAPNLEKYGAKPNIMGTEIGKDVGISGKSEVEVGVTNIAPALIGKRRTYTRPDNWKFHVPTEALKEGQMQMQNPAEFQKELMAREARGEL